MWHLTACKISVSLSVLKWNDFLSYLWINVANINSEIRQKSFHFWSIQKRGTGWNCTGCQMPHFMILLILYFNWLNLSRVKKMSIFEEYGAFNHFNPQDQTRYYAKSVNLDETSRFIRIYTVCHNVFFYSDWNPYLQQWMRPNSKMKELTSETQGWKG